MTTTVALVCNSSLLVAYVVLVAKLGLPQAAVTGCSDNSTSCSSESDLELGKGLESLWLLLCTPLGEEPGFAGQPCVWLLCVVELIAASCKTCYRAVSHVTC